MIINLSKICTFFNFTKIRAKNRLKYALRLINSVQNKVPEKMGGPKEPNKLESIINFSWLE